MGFFDRFFAPPTPDRFAKLVVKALRKAGKDCEIQFDPQNFRLIFHDGHSHYLNLRNFYDEYCQAKRSDRPEQLRKLVRATLFPIDEVLPEEFEDASHDLRPKIWTRSSIESIRRQKIIDGAEYPNLPLQEIGDHLYCTVVYDLPESIRSISPDELEKWGVTFYEAMEVARHNLQESPFAFANIDERLYVSMTGDNYDSARLLLTDLIRKLELKGDPIAMVPNRDHLLIAGSDDEEGLGMLLALTEKTLEEPRPMIATPLRFNSEEWEDWMPPSNHPLYDKFKMLELQWIGGEYATQQQQLNAINEKRGEEVFVATYSGAKKPSGEVFSYCVWSENVDSLLPQTQKVFFIRDGENLVAGGDWEKVQSVVGDLMVPVEEYPPRFRVREFPTAAQLEAIGNESP